MVMDGYSISQGLVDWIFENLPKGSTILELGSGLGSEILSKRYTVYSVEHDRKWVYKYKTNYIYAPLKGNWYDVSKLNFKPYDLLLIDGPPGYIGRKGVLTNQDLFDWSKIIVVDDTHRKEELFISQEVSKIKKVNPIIIESDRKKSDIYV